MSVFLTRTQDVQADTNDHRTIWRLINSSTVADLRTASAGIVSYRRRGSQEELGGSHDFPEIYHVLSGAGVVATPDGETPVSPGDSFIIQAGTPHGIWATTSDSVEAFYVALRGR